MNLTWVKTNKIINYHFKTIIFIWQEKMRSFQIFKNLKKKKSKAPHIFKIKFTNLAQLNFLFLFFKIFWEMLNMTKKKWKINIIKSINLTLIINQKLVFLKTFQNKKQVEIPQNSSLTYILQWIMILTWVLALVAQE